MSDFRPGYERSMEAATPRRCCGGETPLYTQRMAAQLHDARSVANLMLDEGDRIGCRVTNLALQKLLYFAHAMYLIERKQPLVAGYFEAWQYGPVHPAAYRAFQTAADREISFRATRLNIVTGESTELPPPSDPEVGRHLAGIMNSYGRLTPGRLVDIAHAKGAPWDFIVDKGRTSIALGLRIPDNVIVARFKYHKVSVADTPYSGEPGEDSPLA
jgi:uncharacterized phage-associated protein